MRVNFPESFPLGNCFVGIVHLNAYAYSKLVGKHQL